MTGHRALAAGIRRPASRRRPQPFNHFIKPEPAQMLRVSVGLGRATSRPSACRLPEINQIANYAWVEWWDNIKVGDAPSAYWPKYAERFDDADLTEMRRLHALPDGWGTRAVIAALKTAVELAPRQPTTAWRTGADGEAAVAAVLDGLGGWLALHDRCVPGKRSNIDHLVVGPAGVLTVDAKRYKGKLTVNRGVVRVDGRDITKLLDQARSQAAVATVALDSSLAAAHVQPVLCFVGTELPRRHTVVGGVCLSSTVRRSADRWPGIPT